LSVEQRNSSKPKKQPAQAASDVIYPDDDEDFSAGEWLKPRTRSGKAQRKSRELASTSPKHRSAKISKATLKKKPATDAEKTVVGSIDVVVIGDTSDSSSAEQKQSLKKLKEPSASKLSSQVELYPEIEVPLSPLSDGVSTLLPDFTEFDPAKKRTVGFIVEQLSQQSASSELKPMRKRKNKEEAVQGCAPPPHFNDSSSSDDSDEGRRILKSCDKLKSSHLPVGKKACTDVEQRAHQTAKKIKPSDLLEYEVKLSVHQASDDGSCCFDSLSSSLGYILAHHPSSFNFSRFPQSRKVIEAMCDKQALRKALVGHMLLHADEPFDNLGGFTPTETVLRDYVEAQQPLHDPEWLERASLQSAIPLTNHVQRIHSFAHYAEAMSQPCANGDELMVAMFCDLFNLRVIIVELTDVTSSVAMQDDNFILSRVSLDITPRLPLSSDFTVTLVLSSNHYDWAHLSNGLCDDSESHCKMGKATEIVCYTSTPVVYVDADPDFYTPVSHSLIRNHTRENKRTIVKQCLVDEHDVTPHDAELSINTFEKLGGIASMTTLPELLHLHDCGAKRNQCRRVLG
jgi:hypothetical protein